MVKKLCLFLCFFLLQITEALYTVPPNPVKANVSGVIVGGGLGYRF